MVGFDFYGLRLALGTLYARMLSAKDATIDTLSVGKTIDLSEAEVVGFEDLGVRGDYDSPALDTTVTLTSGGDPAARLSWGDFPASAAAGVTIDDPSGTIDEERDIIHFPEQDPADPERREFVFYWQDDPGQDVDLDVTVAKFI